MRYRLRDIFGKGNFFLEVQDQGMEVEKRINRDLVRLSKETGIPLVATNDCHYLTQSDAHAQEVLMCIQTGKTMSDSQRMKFRDGPILFQDGGGNGAGVRRTAGCADAYGGDCGTLQRENPARAAIRFPEFKVPEGHTTDSYFERVAREGFARAGAAAGAACESRIACGIRSRNTRARLSAKFR